jgi:hypothetical protein
MRAPDQAGLVSAAPPSAADIAPAAVRYSRDERGRGDTRKAAAGAKSAGGATQAECWNARGQHGSGGYAACVRRRLRALAPRGKRAPALSALPAKQRKAIERACWGAKVRKQGSCIRQGLDELVPGGPRGRTLASLTPSQRKSIEAVCWSAKVDRGSARAHACVKRQLALDTRRRGPRGSNEMTRAAAWATPATARRPYAAGMQESAPAPARRAERLASRAR